jgi:hypothetical protein
MRKYPVGKALVGLVTPEEVAVFTTRTRYRCLCRAERCWMHTLADWKCEFPTAPSPKLSICYTYPRANPAVHRPRCSAFRLSKGIAFTPNAIFAGRSEDALSSLRGTVQRRWKRLGAWILEETGSIGVGSVEASLKR